MASIFNYDTMITRNIGFVSPEEQAILRQTRVFVPDVGGMGGALVACLARLGVEHFIIVDMDTFEVSNHNRQIFATLSAVGEEKAAVTAKALLNINPNLKIVVKNENWVHELDDILPNVDIVVNGCDDIKSTILLMRRCQYFQKSAIDPFASTLPNVYVILPEDKRPEEVFGYPTVGLPKLKAFFSIRGP